MRKQIRSPISKYRVPLPPHRIYVAVDIASNIGRYSGAV